VLRNFLRVLSGLAGVCLWWPGTWAIIGLMHHHDAAPPANPLFDRIAVWLTTVAIWELHSHYSGSQ
jgi:hypothetical protein